MRCRVLTVVVSDEARLAANSQTRHPLVIFSLPKSASTYFRRSIEAALSTSEQRINAPWTAIKADVIAEQARLLAAQPCGLTGGHIRATRRNIRCLEEAGIKRIAILVRDPRDALVSWWRHLERPDIRDALTTGHHLSSMGLMSPRYYELTVEERLADLIEHMFPAMQEWLADWARAMAEEPRFLFHVTRYEDFIGDPKGHLRGVLRFFGHDAEPVMLGPRKDGAPEQVLAGIDLFTHFRRGVVGSHRDEVAAPLLKRMNGLVDHSLFARYAWTV